MCSIVIGRLRVVEMEDGWVWRHQQGHKAGTGLSECLGHTVSTTPAHFLQLHNTPRPGDNDLMIHRGGTEWTHWSLPDPKEYENTYWKPTRWKNCERHKKGLTDAVMGPGSHSSAEGFLYLAAGLTCCCSSTWDWEHESVKTLLFSVWIFLL